MTFYQQRGIIPHKRHVQFKKTDGTLYREQLMGMKGFDGVQSLLYHHHSPTEFFKSTYEGAFDPAYEPQTELRPRAFFTDLAKNETGDAISNREYILGNDDLLIGVATTNKAMDYFYRNSDGDELLFVHYGSGKIETTFGTIHYNRWDYVKIPIGTIYRVIPEEKTKFLVVETMSWITTPKRYRNEYGQYQEHSPFCERDFVGPESLDTHDEKGEFEVLTRKHNQWHKHYFKHHPLDVVGWDGNIYPWKFYILDHEPITGRIHQPPPVHQTFEGHNFVICSFVPRLFDYHPDAIPAPYYHSNIESDEVLYYVDGDFMSRKGIREGAITLHPGGIPHGPHPGKIEQSIGAEATAELAVMIDTFRPLKVLQDAQYMEDEDYQYSWVEEELKD
ncbi:TPA: homogentisate 1,2-dioxygenase [Staphylococcus pseudintermedius]